MAKRKQYSDDVAKAIAPEERFRCAFTADGQNCPEMGAMTDAIIGPAAGQADARRWLCRWHGRVRHDPAGGRLVLADLLIHRQRTIDNWRDVLLRERMENNRDDPLMARALLIADGKGDDMDKADLLEDLRRRLGSFVHRVTV